jgi:dihydrofolate reductase
MRKFTVFNSVSLDGYFTGADGDLSWMHKGSEDREWTDYVANNAKGGGVLVFGRVTYEMMAGYWTTPEARKQNPIVAERMNALPKIVFSRKLDEATWNNTKLIKGDIVAAVRKLKQEPGDDLVIMGSGSIIAQLAPEGVIDAYQFVLTPVVLGKGRTMFEGVSKNLELKPVKTRSFANGKIVTEYEPAR